MASRVSSPRFVGRRDELDRLDRALAAARAGHPAVLLVGGEAGVGKTRFLAEVAASGRKAGARVIEGGCIGMGGEGLPFGPIIEALRGLPDMLPPAELDELVGAGRSDLARLIPGLIRPDDPLPTFRAEDGSAQGRLFEHLLGLLSRLARRAPLLLLVEDIHWADRSTLDLLGFLTRNIRDGAIVLLASYRSDELHRRHPLTPFLAELERSGRAERLELLRFERFELADMLEGILGDDPDMELVARILTRSEGNAFYAEELLAAGTQGRLPDTLRDVLLARVATLSEPTQELLRVASAGGTRISPALLASVSGTSEEQLEPALREAVAHHLLVPATTAGEDHAFRHALVQEAVYDELLPGERTRLHAAFARALADEGPAEAHASRAAELAYHWAAAHDLPRAFDAWIAAGIAAEAIYAFAEARRDFERALELWDQVPDAAARSPLDRVELLMRAALLAQGPAPSRSVAYIRTAIELVDPVTDPTRAGLLQERLGYYCWIVPDEATAAAAWREAVRLVPAEPPTAARALVLARLGRYLAMTYQPAESLLLCEEALSVAQAAGAREVESVALGPLGLALVLLGETDRGLATIRRAREIAAELGDVHEVAGRLCGLAEALAQAGRLPEAVTAGREAEAYGVRHGLGARWGTNGIIYQAFALELLGRWDEAIEAVTRAQRYEHSDYNELVLELILLRIEANRGQFETADRRAQRVRFLVESFFEWWAFPSLAELALWQDDPLTARVAIRRAVSGDVALTTVSVRRLGWALALGIRAEADLAAAALSRRSDPGVAESREIGARLLMQMRSTFEGMTASDVFYLRVAGVLVTCEGEFSRLEGTPDPDLWATAAAQWHTLQWPHDEAYALMREAEATLALHRDRPRAARALIEARVIARRLGAVPLLRMVEALAARAGISLESVAPASGEQSIAGEPQPTATPPLRDRYTLTAREHEVLELLAAGHSDGEIAERLFISKKTAAVHVANIKGKLGADSRVGIVRDAIGLGLIEAPSSRKS